MSERPQSPKTTAGLAKTRVDDAPATPVQNLTLSELAFRGSLGAEAARDLRYAVQAEIGHGATARVWAVVDRDLARVVALKESRGGDAQRFFQEAASVASLEHPNVPPVYDVGLSDEGAAYYTMKRVDGSSLGVVIEAWLHAPDQALPVQQRLGLIIQVAHALEAAHAHGLVHRDVKPDNIMLGHFGEVFLIDWGAATSVADGGVASRTGTPFYMSPEAAAGGVPCAADDAYSLGATLFHALLLRPPLTAPDVETFWQRKLSGAIDLPQANERSAHPRALLAIALRAIATQPADRYASVADFRRDLVAWLAGDPVTGCPENAWERLGRWHRRHGWRVWAASLVAATLLSLLGLLWHERNREIASWGEPVVHEDFSNDLDWRTRWQVLDGSAHVSGGTLITGGRHDTKLLCTRRLDGAIAVEYQGEILPSSPPCDLSLFYYPEMVETDGRLEHRGHRYYFQLGAYDGSYSAILLDDDKTLRHLAWSAFRPQPGITYRFRIEIADRLMRVLVDGKEILRHEDPLPFTGGWVALYGYYAGKSFANVDIYARGVPQLLSACAVGDAFARLRDHQQAAVEYQRVAVSYPGSELGDEAAYKQGVSREALGEHAAADAAWAGLPPGRWRLLARIAAIDRTIAEGDDAAAIAQIRAIAQDAPADVHRRLAQNWNRWAIAARVQAPERVAPWLELRDQCFANDEFTHFVAADSLLTLGRFAEVPEKFPQQRHLCARALLKLGWPERVVEEFPEQRGLVAKAKSEMGLGLEVPAEYAELIASAHLEAGHLEKAESFGIASQAPSIAMARGDFSALATANVQVQTTAALLQGDAEGALALAGSDPFLRIPPLLALGRIDDARADAPRSWIRFAEWIAVAASLADPQAAWWKLPEQADSQWDDVRVARAAWLLTPVALGDAASWNKALEVLRRRPWVLQQRPWLWAAYLDGLINDERFLAQPYARTAAVDLLWLKAVAAERAGDRVTANAQWAAWLAVPAWQRGSEPDPVAEAFARWRLAGPPSVP